MGFRPDLLSPDDFDEVIAVSTADAFAMARRATLEEGLFTGASSGANVVAALRWPDGWDPVDGSSRSKSTQG